MANHLQENKTYRLGNDVFLCQRIKDQSAGNYWFMRDLNKSRTRNGVGHIHGYLINDQGAVYQWAYEIGPEFPNRAKAMGSPIPRPDLSTGDFTPCLVSSKEINLDDLMGQAVWKGRGKSESGLSRYLLT